MKHADNVITSLNIITYYNNFLQCYELLYHHSRVSWGRGIVRRRNTKKFVAFCLFVRIFRLSFEQWHYANDFAMESWSH